MFAIAGVANIAVDAKAMAKKQIGVLDASRRDHRRSKVVES
jgi:hypothetical protein